MAGYTGITVDRFTALTGEIGSANPGLHSCDFNHKTMPIIGIIAMNKQKPDEITLSPVTGWSFSTIPSYNAIYLEFSYLSSPLQKLDEASLSQKFLFQQQQLRELRTAIDNILQKLESDGFQPQPPDHLQ